VVPTDVRRDISTIVVTHTADEALKEDASLPLCMREANLMGVRHVWVHSSSRKAKIGSTMMDVARMNFFCGSVVSKSRMAFSQPTSDGLKFALGYCKSDTILTYS
jgi:N-acetyltransferase